MSPPAPLATYDPGQVNISFLGNALVGFDEDSQIVVERITELFTDKVGADGSVVRTRTRDKRTKVTLKLLQTSPSNDVLSAAVALDQSGQAYGPLLVTDVLSPGTVLHGGQAWVAKLPNAEYGKEAGSREWVFTIASGDMFVGGNPA